MWSLQSNQKNVLALAAKNDDIKMIKLLLNHNIYTYPVKEGKHLPLNFYYSDQAMELIVSHALSNHLPPTYPKEAKQICLSINFALEHILELSDRADEDKDIAQINKALSKLDVALNALDNTKSFAKSQTMWSGPSKVGDEPILDVKSVVQAEGPKKPRG